MNKKIMILTTSFIILQVIKLLLLWDYKACYGTSRIEIFNTQGVTEQSGLSVKAKEAYQIAESSCKENQKVENTQVDVVAVNTYWHQVQGIQMLEGNFWEEEPAYEGRNLVVISDTLAIDLWASEKAVGNRVHIENQVYKVVGVYKHYQHIWQYVLDDGKEKVYIPLKSSLSNEWPVQFLVINGTDLKTLPEENEVLSWGISCNTFSHYEKWFRQQRSLVQLPIALVVVLLLGYLLRKIQRAITNSKYSWKKKLLIVGGLLMLMLILLSIGMRGIYINPAQLPSENIFDLAFYWQATIKEWSRHNQILRYPASQFEGAYYLFKHWNYFINFVQILMGIKIVSLLKRSR